MGANYKSLWNALATASAQIENGKVDELVSLIESLPDETKAELLKRLQSSLQSSTQFETNSMSSPLIIQINKVDKEAMAALLYAIAERMGGVPPQN